MMTVCEYISAVHPFSMLFIIMMVMTMMSWWWWWWWWWRFSPPTFFLLFVEAHPSNKPVHLFLDDDTDDYGYINDHHRLDHQDHHTFSISADPGSCSPSAYVFWWLFSYINKSIPLQNIAELNLKYKIGMASLTEILWAPSVIKCI